MPRPAASRLRSFVRRWIARREMIPFVPALLLCGLWFGGEMVLVVAAVVAPALYVLGRDAAPGDEPRRDGLTGLPLREELLAHLDAALLTGPLAGRSTTVFAVAIDDWEGIEALHGRSAAEQVLRRSGERIATVLRDSDALARIEGAVFAIALWPAGRNDLESALQLAARIQAAVREPVLAQGARVHASCSVGFCLGARAPRPGGPALLGAALEALEEARASGPGATRAYAAERAAARPRGAIEGAEALAALDAGQIRPWFQPQLSTDTGTVSGFEALARWEHPERGVIAPADFLPALMAAGATERLGEQVLFHGLSALRSWDRAGYTVPSLAVNFSAEELRNPRLPEKIGWELDRFDLAPERLTVEILETVMADAEDESVVRTIAGLGALGCRIDLDDFGTGQASIAALRRFAVRRIKIDRSLVINVDEDREQQRMVTAILRMAESLGLETLAEGVERVGEHAMLAQLGCGHVQGFGIARAMPFEETIGWMQRHAEKLAETSVIVRRAV